ncbi:hypothetical protein PYCC9005_001126 [Savitreella phatthalungensis]
MSDSDDDREWAEAEPLDPALMTLPEPELLQYSMSGLYRRYLNGELDLQPYYQRDVVWREDRQSKLINSLFNNFVVPPVIVKQRYVNVPGRDKPVEVMAVIDGKQRLSSVFAFLNGTIPYIDPTKQRWFFPTMDAANKQGKLLTKAMLKEFRAKTFMVVVYKELQPAQEEELFARFQQGMPLTHAERVQACSGPWNKLVDCLLKEYPTSTVLTFTQTRGNRFGHLIQAVIVCWEYAKGGMPKVKTWTASSIRLRRLVACQDGAPTQRFCARLTKVFSVLADIVKARPDIFSHTFPFAPHRFSPIEFAATVLLVDRWLDHRDDLALADDILGMRQWIRSDKRVVDLKTNSTTWLHFWAWIDQLTSMRGEARRPHARPQPPPLRGLDDIQPQPGLVPESKINRPSGIIEGYEDVLGMSTSAGKKRASDGKVKSSSASSKSRNRTAAATSTPTPTPPPPAAPAKPKPRARRTGKPVSASPSVAGGMSNGHSSRPSTKRDPDSSISSNDGGDADDDDNESGAGFAEGDADGLTDAIFQDNLASNPSWTRNGVSSASHHSPAAPAGMLSTEYEEFKAFQEFKAYKAAMQQQQQASPGGSAGKRSRLV